MITTSLLTSILLLAMLPDESLAASTVKRANGKRGIAWTSRPEDVDKLRGSQVSWLYNWANHPDDFLSQGSTGLQYVPMQWGSGGAGDFARIVRDQGASVVLVRPIDYHFMCES